MTTWYSRKEVKSRLNMYCNFISTIIMDLTRLLALELLPKDGKSEAYLRVAITSLETSGKFLSEVEKSFDIRDTP